MEILLILIILSVAQLWSSLPILSLPDSFLSFSGPNIQMMVGPGLALHPFFPTSSEWNVVKLARGGSGNLGLGRKSTRCSRGQFEGEAVWSSKAHLQAWTWVWGSENSHLPSWILAAPDNQAASRAFSFSACRTTDAVGWNARETPSGKVQLWNLLKGTPRRP